MASQFDTTTMASFDQAGILLREAELKRARDERSATYRKKLEANVDSKMKVQSNGVPKFSSFFRFKINRKWKPQVLVKYFLADEALANSSEPAVLRLDVDRSITVHAFKRLLSTQLRLPTNSFKLIVNEVVLREEQILEAAISTRKKKQYPLPYVGKSKQVSEGHQFMKTTVSFFLSITTQGLCGS